MQEHRFTFIGGVHKSGTTFLLYCLGEHPQMSAFRGADGVPAEGQLVQTVYPRAQEHGGPGRFGFAPEAHLTEDSPLVSAISRARLLEEWAPYWDLGRPMLVEKSPPNLIRARFLQALFPEASFVMIVRHPLAVAYSTQGRFQKKSRIGRLVRHWIACHDTFAADLPMLERLQVVRYEQLVADFQPTIAEIDAFLGLEAHTVTHDAARPMNDAHLERWHDEPERDDLIERFEQDVNRFGYSLVDWNRADPWP